MAYAATKSTDQEHLRAMLTALPRYAEFVRMERAPIEDAIRRVREITLYDVRCVQFAEWLASADRVTGRFITACRRADANVIVLVTEGLLLPHTKKSGDWMARNFLHCDWRPAASVLLLDVLMPDERAVAVLRSAASGGRVPAFAVFDDAAYSGRKLAETLVRLSEWWRLASDEHASMAVHVVLPFATARAIRAIEHAIEHALEAGDAQPHEVTQPFARFQVRVICDAVLPPAPPMSLAPATTFMEHKVPDGRSFPHSAAIVLERELGIIPPYKARDATWRRLARILPCQLV